MIRPEVAINAMSSAVIVTPLIFATGRARLVRVTRALLVTFATLLATLALAQTDAGSESTPTEPVEVVPAAPPATPAPPLQADEAAPSTPPVSAPTSPPVLEKPTPVEPAPVPLPAATDKPPDTPSAAPIASPAPTSSPRQGPSAGKRDASRPAATLTIVNGRAVPATGVAVLVGAKVVRRSGPLAPTARVTLKLPSSIGCRVSVVASFSWGYSSLRYSRINVCKVGHALVRL